LINNLLDVARIESNRKDSLQLHKEDLDLVKEIKDSIKTQLYQKIKDKNIVVNFIKDSLDEHCWVCADKLRLNQIIINLLDNAIKFSNQIGKIDIIIHENISNSFNVDQVIKERIIERENHNIQEIFVSVSDTGKGISPQIMPKLFEKFITGSDKGTGLGLFITRKLVEAHGGRIWAFNNKDGVGSTFIFSLPRSDDDTLRNR
jgi:signal transduction histidine kinase